MSLQFFNRFKKRLSVVARPKYFHLPWSIVLKPAELSASFAALERNATATKSNRHRVAIGSKVTLFDVREKDVITLVLTNSRDSKPESGFVSCLSPIGRELFGRIAGDVIEVKVFFRTEMFRIVRVEE